MVELNLDLDFNDMAIWAFIHKFSTSQSCRKIHEDGTTYYWVSRELIVDQLPKLCIGSKSGIRQRVEKLIKAKLIVRHPDNRKMNQSFYAFGPNSERLFFESTPGLKKDQHQVVKKTSPALSEDMYNSNKQVNKGKEGEPSPILSYQRGIETSNKHQKEIFQEAPAGRDLTEVQKHLPTYPFFTSEFEAVWKDFIEMRRKKRKPLTDRAITLNLNVINRLSNGRGDLAIKICEQTIMRGWDGFFELKVTESVKTPSKATFVIGEKHNAAG